MWKTFRCRASFALVSCLVATVSFANQTDINFNQAILKTLENNPELISFGYQVQAQQGLLEQATLSPNPELSVEFENFLGTGDFNGIDALETTISIGWILERRVRKQRISVAQAGVSYANTQAKIAQIDAASETARRYVECLSNQERLRLAYEIVELAENNLAAIQKRVSVSKVPAAELARAKADLAVKKLAYEDVQHEISISYRKLSAQWGETSPDFNYVQGSLYALPKPDSFESLLNRIEQNPEFDRLLSQRRMNEAELQLAEAMGKPQWKISTGIRRFEEQDDHAFVVDLTVPLTFKNRNQGTIAAANARLARIDADQRLTSIRLNTQLYELYEELQHSLHRTETYQNIIIPAVSQAAQDSQVAYERGRYSYQEWQAAQSELLNAKEEYLEAMINAHIYVIEIERVTGVQVSKMSTSKGVAP